MSISSEQKTRTESARFKMGNFTLAKWIACFTIFSTFLTISGYNLDTKSSIIFRSDPGNYFGFTVALHRNRDGAIIHASNHALRSSP
ncbi:hypothetical protein CEXT_49781 [Caerostris extrusa]|uniref:Uncharacterized protein n=1 Tax=Caerostris extrusa TaxID=172846 RepID=A0AAV4XD08_CAEEX|nr:hypothetical protein CEXT_49781 [Caerostris extrusa]